VRNREVFATDASRTARTLLGNGRSAAQPGRRRSRRPRTADVGYV